ncbi:MAG: CPBP family intramembrane metalloprotease [Paludibacteraceae bacterium]|nr:CPBP family intramembrane metalloprotease [Paludibacteraceae bacterium]
MRNSFFRILLWLAVIAVFTLAAMGIWLIASGGSQSTESLKWLQFLQTLGTFTLPPILCAWLWNNHKPFSWLKLNKGLSWQTALLAIGIMICAIPAINLLADLNSRIVLPKSLDFIEQFLKQQEEAAAVLTERFLQADNFGTLLINIGLMALLPALAEELSFRGTLQQILSHSESSERSFSGSGLSAQRSYSHRRSALAIWLTAIIFSAIHMQFYGFIPRMLLGAMFGYVFLWTGSLWAPILMHFTNNAIAVISYYLTANSQWQTANGTNLADTFGAGSTWWIGVLSLLITSLGLLIFVRRTHKE